MGGGIDLDYALEHPERVWGLVLVASGLGGFESTEEEDDWWAERDAPIEAAIEAGDLERAQELRLEIWAPLGTDDERGARIREIAFDNIHELTMDESGAEQLDPPAAHRLGGDRRADADPRGRARSAGHAPRQRLPRAWRSWARGRSWSRAPTTS